MKNNPGMALRVEKAPAGAARLDSWKEIAGYLRRGTRTVQRWEREESLPVHRVHHEKLGSVYAYREELDAWLARRAEMAPKPAAASEMVSVAVLPFTDMSREGDQAYFCDGIAEEIINSLSRIAGLHTASRTSSFRFRGTTVDVREVGRQLGAATLLEGSVRKSGGHLRIAVDLVDTQTGFQLWAHRYDREMRDVFEIQDQIAESVVRALRVALTPREEASLHAAPAATVGAYDCYLRGRKFYYEYHPKAVELAIRMFCDAIKLDPDYVRAYAALADCWSYLYLYSNRNNAILEQADWASRKAQEMDPYSAQAQASRGQSLSLSGRNGEAEDAFAAAIRLDPGLFEAHYFRARHYFARGLRQEAAASYEAAMRARPDDFQAPLLVAQIYQDLGRHADAAAVRKQGIAAAERHLQLNPDDARALYMMANGLVALGDHHRSRRCAEAALALRGEDPMLLYNLGCIFSMLGDVNDALDCLERAARGGVTQKEWYQHDSNLDPLRRHARFQELMASLNSGAAPLAPALTSEMS